MYKYIQEGNTPLHYVSNTLRDYVVANSQSKYPSKQIKIEADITEPQKTIIDLLKIEKDITEPQMTIIDLLCVAGADPAAKNNVCELK